MSTFFKNCRRLISDMPSRLSSAGITSDESCENCHVNFNIIRKKRACSKCLRWFCSDCLVKRDMSCRSCVVLNNWPVQRPQLLQLKARDIKAFLTANGVSTHGCVEKEELVELALHYLRNRNQTSHSPCSVSTRLVDESWVLINNTPTADVSTSVPDPAAANPVQSEDMPSNSETLTSNVENTEVNTLSDHPSSSSSSTTLPIPIRVSLDNASSMSSSLPPLSSLDENMAEDRTTPNANLSESQPNLFSDPTASTAHTNEARGGSNLSSSQLSVNDTVLSMSRTDLAALSDDDLKALSIRNLKVVLASHRVDFRGCCEKAELLERAVRLRQQLQAQAKIDVEELSDANLCKVCMAAPIDCVLLDCGHLVACTPCGKQMNECPVCRQYVVRVVKTFRA